MIVVTDHNPPNSPIYIDPHAVLSIRAYDPETPENPGAVILIAPDEQIVVLENPDDVRTAVETA